MSENNFPYSLYIMDAIKLNYENFRLETHNLNHKGLFHDDTTLYAVIPEIASNINLKMELERIYNEKSIAHLPKIKIVEKVLPSFRKICLSNSIEKVYLHGESINNSEFLNYLNTHIPKKYHPFNADINWRINEFTLTLKKDISSEAKEEITLILESLGFNGFNYKFTTNKDLISTKASEDSLNKLDLIASSLLPTETPKKIVEKYEEDEDFWIKNRFYILTGNDLISNQEILPTSFTDTSTKCFIDSSIFRKENLRIYISLYEKVIISLPLKISGIDFYKSFGVTKIELKELIKRGRLLFVAPCNIALYDQNLLQEIIDVDPDAIIFSRKLASVTLKGIQERTCINGITLPSDCQYNILHAFSQIEEESIQIFSKSLAEQWKRAEFFIEKYGANSIWKTGLLDFICLSNNKGNGKDIFHNLFYPSRNIEFAQGLKAHYSPYESDKYSEFKLCELIYSLYNGVVNNENFIKESQVATLLNKLLAINNDMNILSLDDALTKYNIRAIPNVLKNYKDLDNDELDYKIYELNKEIINIENKFSKLEKFDLIRGAIPAICATTEVTNPYIPLGLWALSIVLNTLPHSDFFENPLFTKIASKVINTPYETMIIKRTRESIQKNTK